MITLWKQQVHHKPIVETHVKTHEAGEARKAFKHDSCVTNSTIIESFRIIDVARIPSGGLAPIQHNNELVEVEYSTQFKASTDLA